MVLTSGTMFLTSPNGGEEKVDTAGGKRTMKASEFKARCLKLMDDLADGGG